MTKKNSKNIKKTLAERAELEVIQKMSIEQAQEIIEQTNNQPQHNLLPTLRTDMSWGNSFSGIKKLEMRGHSELALWDGRRDDFNCLRDLFNDLMRKRDYGRLEAMAEALTHWPDLIRQSIPQAKQYDLAQANLSVNRETARCVVTEWQTVEQEAELLVERQATRMQRIATLKACLAESTNPMITEVLSKELASLEACTSDSGAIKGAA